MNAKNIVNSLFLKNISFFEGVDLLKRLNEFASKNLQKI